jgi:hypothetical protein
LNSAQVFLDPVGRPLIVYTRYGDDGRNVVVIARLKESAWRTTVVARAEAQTAIEGGGTLAAVPQFGNLVLVPTAREASIDVGFPGAAVRRQTLDYDTFAPLGPPQGIPAARHELLAQTMPRPKGLVQPVASLLAIRRAGASAYAQPGGYLYYVAQTGRRDLPCQPGEPRACDPPSSPIIYIEAE